LREKDTLLTGDANTNPRLSKTSHFNASCQVTIPASNDPGQKRC